MFLLYDSIQPKRRRLFIVVVVARPVDNRSHVETREEYAGWRFPPASSPTEGRVWENPREDRPVRGILVTELRLGQSSSSLVPSDPKWMLG